MWSGIGLATARNLRVGTRLTSSNVTTTLCLRPQVTVRSFAAATAAVKLSDATAKVSTPKRSVASAATEKKKTADAEKKAAAKEKEKEKKAALREKERVKKAALKKKEREKKAALKEKEKEKAKAAAEKKQAAEREKKAAAKKKQDAQKPRQIIKELQATALTAEQPGKLPTNSWLLFLAENVSKRNPGERHPDFCSRILPEFKALPESELKRLQEKTAQNRLANDAALKAWILKHTPAEIHRANLARRKLKTQYGKSLRFLKDDRIPKRPAAPYMLFIKSKYQTGEDIGVNAETSRKIVAEWKALSPAERQPFIENYNIDRVRYQQQVKEVFGKELLSE